MDVELKARLTSGDVWMRALYMIFFAIAYGVAELLIVLTVVFQFLAILFTGSANAPLLRFGRNLSEYVFQIIQFETFNSEAKPFPLSDWPDEEPDGEQWQGAEADASGEKSGVTETDLDESDLHETERGEPEISDTADVDRTAPAIGAESGDASDSVSKSPKDANPPPA